MQWDPPSKPMARSAAFFDVDGTLVHNTIVNYYVYFRKRQMGGGAGRFWMTGYVLKCLYYLILDRIDRSRFNTAFYQDYKGLDARATFALCEECHREVIEPKLFPAAASCVADQIRGGRKPVFVTGSLEFIVRPLARMLGVDEVVAPSLVVRDGRFTGALDGPPLCDAEKARRVRQFAESQGIDLAASHAYGDSLADLPMLEAVGFPNAVNPDRKLSAVALRRGWPMHTWTLA